MTGFSPAAGDAAAFDRLMRTRHSCRAFLPREVAPAIVEDILRTAQCTASWCNVQPWHLVVTSGHATHEIRMLLADAARMSGPNANEGSDIPFPPVYRGVYLERRRAAGFQLYDAAGVRRGDRAAGAAQAMRNFDLFDAPHLVVVSAPRELGTYAVIDCGAWVANFMTAAWSRGVSSIAQASVARQSALLHRHFAIPDELQVVCGVSFGYEDVTHPANGYRTARASPDEAVRWIDTPLGGDATPP